MHREQVAAQGEEAVEGLCSVLLYCEVAESLDEHGSNLTAFR